MRFFLLSVLSWHAGNFGGKYVSIIYAFVSRLTIRLILLIECFPKRLILPPCTAYCWGIVEHANMCLCFHKLVQSAKGYENGPQCSMWYSPLETYSAFYLASINFNSILPETWLTASAWVHYACWQWQIVSAIRTSVYRSISDKGHCQPQPIYQKSMFHVHL